MNIINNNDDHDDYYYYYYCYYYYYYHHYYHHYYYINYIEPQSTPKNASHLQFLGVLFVACALSDAPRLAQLCTELRLLYEFIEGSPPYYSRPAAVYGCHAAWIRAL